MIKNILIFIGIVSVYSGCASLNLGVNQVSNSSITSQKLQNKSDTELIDMEDKRELQKIDMNKELYFADTKGKIFYSGTDSAKTDIGYRVELLLNDLFLSAKNRLPRISRRKKLNISLEISKYSDDKELLLEVGQQYILDKKRYVLTNTDEKSMKVLKRVLRREQDGIYKQRHSIKARNQSDIILFISSLKEKNNLRLKAKIISKNGEILGQAQSKIDLNIKSNQQWVKVKVPRTNAPAQLFEVMKMPVSKEEYRSADKGNKNSVTNISYVLANQYCLKHNSTLLHPYVFEYARRSLAMQRPTAMANIEIMAPYDDEDHEVYYQDGDNLEAGDSTIVTFHWDSGRYFAVSNLFKSSEATFRCMRSK